MIELNCNAESLINGLGNSPLRIGVISNPLSGGNRSGLHWIPQVLNGYPLAEHRTARDPGEIAAVLEAFARSGVELLVLNGGDGTIHAALTVLFNRAPFPQTPPLALLRAGTASMLARDLGLDGRPLAALRRVCAWAYNRQGKVVVERRPVLRVNTDGEVGPLYGMFFGAAAIYQGIDFFQRKIQALKLQGEWSPALTLMLFLLRLLRKKHRLIFPERMAIELDGKRLAGEDWILTLATTLKRLILGFQPFWNSLKGPVQFTAINARHRHLASLAPYLLSGRRHRKAVPENGYVNAVFKEVRMQITGGFAIDGELYPIGNMIREITVQNGGRANFLQVVS